MDDIIKANTSVEEKLNKVKNRLYETIESDHHGDTVGVITQIALLSEVSDDLKSLLIALHSTSRTNMEGSVNGLMLIHHEVIDLIQCVLELQQRQINKLVELDSRSDVTFTNYLINTTAKQRLWGGGVVCLVTVLIWEYFNVERIDYVVNILKEFM